VTRKIATALMALGLSGLALSFRALIREQLGAGLYGAGGVILLAVGALLFWLTSKVSSNPSANSYLNATSNDDERPGLPPSNAVLYVSVSAYLVLTIVMTVIMISGEKGPGGIIFMWLLFVGFAVFVIARSVVLKDHT
jgi:uncharacterized membrane protein YidH (DUF202 family)